VYKVYYCTVLVALLTSLVVPVRERKQ